MDWLWQHLPRLRKILRRRGRTPEDTEDLIQELFLRVMIYCQDGREVRDPEHFLSRSLLNLSSKLYDRDHRNLYVSAPVEDLVLEDFGNAPEQHAAADDILKRLQRTLDSLEPRTREVYTLHRLHGCSYEQIAAQFDISVSAIEKHMAKATIALTLESLRK